MVTVDTSWIWVLHKQIRIPPSSPLLYHMGTQREQSLPNNRIQESTAKKTNVQLRIPTLQLTVIEYKTHDRMTTHARDTMTYVIHHTNQQDWKQALEELYMQWKICMRKIKGQDGAYCWVVLPLHNICIDRGSPCVTPSLLSTCSSAPHTTWIVNPRWQVS